MEKYLAGYTKLFGRDSNGLQHWSVLHVPRKIMRHVLRFDYTAKGFNDENGLI